MSLWTLKVIKFWLNLTLIFDLRDILYFFCTKKIADSMKLTAPILAQFYTVVYQQLVL